MELNAHNESVDTLSVLRASLILEKEVNTVQKSQLKKEGDRSYVLARSVEDLRKEHEGMVKDSEEEIERLYKDVARCREEVKSVQGEKMQRM